MALRSVDRSVIWKGQSQETDHDATLGFVFLQHAFLETPMARVSKKRRHAGRSTVAKRGMVRKRAGCGWTEWIWLGEGGSKLGIWFPYEIHCRKGCKTRRPKRYGKSLFERRSTACVRKFLAMTSCEGECEWEPYEVSTGVWDWRKYILCPGAGCDCDKPDWPATSTSVIALMECLPTGMVKG